jgi:hypothetical protein
MRKPPADDNAESSIWLCLVQGTISLRITGGGYSLCERSVGMMSGTSIVVMLTVITVMVKTKLTTRTLSRIFHQDWYGDT